MDIFGAICTLALVVKYHTSKINDLCSSLNSEEMI